MGFEVFGLFLFAFLFVAACIAIRVFLYRARIRGEAKLAYHAVREEQERFYNPAPTPSGSPAVRSAGSRFCTSCGHAIGRASNFCPDCGKAQ